MKREAFPGKVPRRLPRSRRSAVPSGTEAFSPALRAFGLLGGLARAHPPYQDYAARPPCMNPLPGRAKAPAFRWKAGA